MRQSIASASLNFHGHIFSSAVCSDPGMPENGVRIGNDFGDGQMVAYRCNANFNLVGSSTSFCVAGQWNSTKPTCKGIMYLIITVTISSNVIGTCCILL